MSRYPDRNTSRPLGLAVVATKFAQREAHRESDGLGGVDFNCPETSVREHCLGFVYFLRPRGIIAMCCCATQHDLRR
jgi:hypothetical protein